MRIKQVFIRPNTELSKRIAEWTEGYGIVCTEITLDEDFEENIDGLVIFNQDQELDKEISDIRNLFDGRQKPVIHVDFDGTLMVGVSNFSLWVERNSCKNILVVGNESLIQNPNLERFLGQLKVD